MADARAPDGRVPIPESLVAAVADRESVAEADLVDALATIHADLMEGGDAIHRYYVASDDGHPSPIVADRGLVEILFVDPATWDQMADRLDLPGSIRDATRAVHAEFARRHSAGDEAIAARDALVMPSERVAGLVRAGLSPRQAEVQVLRTGGATQREIGETLRMETGTVKSHCHRIDEKVERARRLLDRIEG